MYMLQTVSWVEVCLLFVAGVHPHEGAMVGAALGQLALHSDFKPLVLEQIRSGIGSYTCLVLFLVQILGLNRDLLHSHL